METQDSYDTRQAKQKASVKWLLSKAFNNKVPENLREPFYRDHENQEYLKPQILGSLANAELYCLALGNIYSDPNYHNLNHGSIIQTLARKGVLNEPSEVQLTETVLIQTNPLRMTAHMAVIEAMQALYAKEVVTGDRVVAAVQRFNPDLRELQFPQDHEKGLLLWVDQACLALKKRVQASGNQFLDDLRPVISIEDLFDGLRLACLVSYYCPDELPSDHLVVNRVPSVSDTVHNLTLVYEFCRHCLPYPVFHMTPEDVTYLKRTMKLNLIGFLADMFNVLEIHPVKCVRYPGADKAREIAQYPSRNIQGVMHKRSVIQTVVSPIPDLRSSLDDTSAPAAFQVSRPQSAHMSVRKTQSLQSSPSESTDNGTRDPEEGFVVHRGRAVPTLSSVLTSDEPLVPARLRPAKEKQNNDTKDEEMGNSRFTAAGKPSNWDDKKTSYAGRRSRRNSVSDDSQLTIENFGGSQEHLNMIGRNPDKELTVHSGRKISAPSFPVHEHFESNLPVRSKLSDSRSNIHLGYDSDSEKQDKEKESTKLTRQLSSDAISLKNILHSKQQNRLNDSIDGELPVNRLLSFADISKQNVVPVEAYKNQSVYMVGEEENIAPPATVHKPIVEKKTTFAALPNTTTWQQQSNNVQQLQQQMTPDDGNIGQQLMTSQLNDIRMKLEEKRKHIENEKKKIELVVNRQRQKVGKAAFLQAINKGKSTDTKSPSGSSDSAPGSEPRSPTSDYDPPNTQKPMRNLQDLSEDAMSAEIKRLIQNQQQDVVYSEPVTQHIEMDIEHYHQTINNSRMNNASLQEMHVDIQRLAAQHQLNQLKSNDILLNEQKQQILRQQLMHPQQMYHVQQPQQAPQPFNNITQPYVPYGSPNQYMSMTSVPQYASPTPDNQFYLHDQPNRRTWKSPQTNNQGFMLHEPANNETHHEISRYQNGDHRTGFSLSQQHSLRQNQSVHSEPNTPQRASPQHRVAPQTNNIHRQISQLMGDGDNKTSFATLAQHSDSFDKSKNTSGIHHAIPTPPVDDMEPQNISFIGNAEDSYVQGISKLNISSGTRTYRIPSPTRPHISRNSFQPTIEQQPSLPEPDTSSNEKGFYISFDNEQPKKPKPPLRLKRGSPKKEKPSTSINNIENEINVQGNISIHNMDIHENMARERHKSAEEVKKVEAPIQKQKVPIVESAPPKEPGTALVIGNELKNLDPNSVDEMERKKERIMLLSLQRRQKQEELKEKKEAETQARREKEKQKEEERLRRKQEQEARRLAILEQHKLKKAIEEAEREGKVLDESKLMGMGTMKSATKMRSKASTGRPRPKTIHVDSGSVEMAEGMLQPSQGKKGSTTNLSVNTYTPSSTLRRDYYRGSQDSLADRSSHGKGLYRDVDERGPSPLRSTNTTTVNRRSSYVTSRENHGQVRDRPKYPTIQTFKGRKSNSMMNLYGSSSDQDSMAYRYGDTDSGLGRATPPRRAPSPGMGGLRHLPSPSGPGSLPPGLAPRRRHFDDGCSDASSTPSSMLGEYTGPRLYKQPATKSNRGIMLNAVEYCVFPGVVNKEAKQRVLEEIARSESKHFLILFRDAGCQFRALYSYCPDRDEVLKLYGTGPKQVNDKMFDKFFKYNSGGKCFSQVHTKHLTVTIDAFTIHNSLWQGKKVNLPSKKDMALVI